MPNWIQGPELIVILLIVIIIFGAGRIGKILGEFGKGIRAFRKEVKGDEPESTEQPEDKQEK